MAYNKIGGFCDWRTDQGLEWQNSNEWERANEKTLYTMYMNGISVYKNEWKILCVN